MTAGKRFQVDIHLAGGTVITSEIGQDQLEDLKRTNPDVALPPGVGDHEAVGRIILTSLVVRMDLGTGLYMIPDVQGRHWIVSAKDIIAASVTGFADGETPAQLGFVNRDPVNRYAQRQ